MDTTIVIVAVILTLLGGVFAYFAYLADGAESERR